ncbi:MAG: tyrosine-type recombinase/integrase [Burkholderiaceae bacterium]|nr:tyrosine-type recombinase/integrase [Burkholderiaceae bacterium]
MPRKISNALTDRALRNLKPATKARTYGDGAGLFIEVLPSGSKAWRVEFRVGGKRERLTLGQYPALSLTGARAEAARIRKEVADGRNPAQEARRRRVEQLEASRVETVERDRTVGALVDLYVREVVRLRHRHPGKAERTLERFIREPLGELRVADISKADVEGAVFPIRDRGRPAMASAVLRQLRQLLDHGAALGWRGDNPAREIRPEGVHVARSRSRTLKQSELSLMLRTVYASNASRAVKLAVHLLVLTGCRKSEIVGGRWNEIDAAARTWVIPAHRYKTGVEHTVYLSDQALALLEELRQLSAGSEFVCPSHKKPGVSMSPSTINQALRVMGWSGDAFTVHDVRRTFVTLANELGLADPHVIEASVGHRIGGSMVRTYNRASYAAERRVLADRWGAFVEDLIGDRKVIVGGFGAPRRSA